MLKYINVVSDLQEMKTGGKALLYLPKVKRVLSRTLEK